jgi:transposase
VTTPAGTCPAARSPAPGCRRSPAAARAHQIPPGSPCGAPGPGASRPAIRAAAAELAANKRHLAGLIRGLAPALLDKTGAGPVSAAQAIVSWSHRGRCRSDAAFAALAGASPLQASSGRTTRHRLNRGGGRQLNRALHDITLTR